ncbi:PREDICTED: bicaudal D-related protein 2 [Nanorana parkeri]|uniref:bicaudal D-related protein 2 n=1 Tax=Nanorana parkeri TaxID=125878 RepID=UPI000853F143|nr:PREDICTED: bicaudal D-related protein 2 [Nanorana parkeri]
MTSREAESHSGILRGWNGGLPSPTMEEDFYPFLLERRPSYLGEEEAEQQEEDLSLALERKGKDLLLAAELGKALLERNDYLERGREALEEELRETRERLEQEKHALRLKMEVRESEWKAQIADLEGDLSEARLQVRQLMSEHRECGRENATAVHEMSEQNQRLLEQLAQTSQLEQSLTLQLQNVREENRELNLSQGQLAPCLQSLQSENALLLEQKRDLESGMKQLREKEENAQNLLFTLRETALRMERQRREGEAQLQEVQAEVQHLRGSQRSLQNQVQELQDELKMRDSQTLHDSRYSLHSEMEDCQDGPINPSAGLGPQTAQAPDPGVHMMAYLTQREKDFLQEKEEEVIRLQDQVTIQYVEINSLREELQKLRYDCPPHGCPLCPDVPPQEVSPSYTFPSRGRALRVHVTTCFRLLRKGELELELAKCRLEKDSMSRQLLSAVEQKVLLSQELEAWQDDMQIVINQQLKTQRDQEKASDSSPGTPTRKGSPRRARDNGNGIFSFFKRI